MSTPPPTPQPTPDVWPTGGGELGALVRQLDWSKTGLGPIAEWSQSLRTAVNLVLSSPMPIVMLWGPDGIMIYNDAYSGFAGGRHPQLLGSPVLEGWPEVADFNRRVMDVALGGGTLSFHDQQLVLHRHGVPEDVWMDLSYSPIHDEKGKPVGVLAIVVETTTRVLAERQIRALNETLERQVHTLAELDRAKTSFFTNISHEFRTPLTLMLGPTEDALRADPRVLAGADLETVYRNGLRLLKLVNALLDFSRIEAGQMRASFAPTDLTQLTTDLACAFRTAAERGGLEYIVRCQPTEQVFVDREMWEKIVFNLLSNALKFTLRGQIALSLEDAGDHVELRVQDTGIGIAREDLPRLFERFHRVDGAQARTQEGSGIGLALVDDLVRLHGGRVTVASESGQGTTLTVRLPKGHRHLPADQLVPADGAPHAPAHAAAFVEEAARWSPASEPATDPWPAAVQRSEPALTPLPGHILVADDNADMRDYLTRVLQQHWSVDAVADGAAALRTIQARVPDVIVTDVMMPGLDGVGLLGALRADDRTAHVPVIMVSARAGEEARIEGLQRGADDYLAKPFSAGELVARVNGQLRLASARQELVVLREAAEAANRAKDEFLAMLGHELRNPLAPILTALQLIRLRGLDGAERERAIIERQVTHLVELVDDLLDVSRITQGKIDLRRAPVEAADFVARAIEVASPVLEQQRHALTVNVPRTGLTVDGDAARLAQVVANLVTNAAKYTEPGGMITVTGRVEGEDVAVRVRDTGIGIDGEMLPFVFDMFFQERQTIERSRGGLGLGLAIVRSLVALHGGSVSVHSDGKGKGSEFVVRLPRLQRLTEDAVDRQPAAVAPQAVAGRGRVLVVDDNEDAALLLAEMLSAFGYIVQPVHDGPTALRVAETFRPDIALFDIGLPVMDGYELARRFAEHPRLARTRLVAITGYGQQQDRDQSTAAGFVAHLVKPVELDTLRNVVTALMDASAER
jgi:PAS domain S-box-containing protein